jgi:hypothetical protein
MDSYELSRGKIRPSRVEENRQGSARLDDEKQNWEDRKEGVDDKGEGSLMMVIDDCLRKHKGP